jgi:hypothetical protein
MLSGWLRAGYSRSDPAGGWRNYLLTDVSALQVLDAPFAGTRPGYAAHDPRMREVFCELTPSAADAPVEGPYIVREPTWPAPNSAPQAPSDTPRDVPREGSPIVEAARTRDGESDRSRPAP